MKAKLLLLTLSWMMSWAGSALAAETLNDILQKGLFEEEANHNLDAAIKAYQRVIQQTEEQRRLTATALFRLGECYRKEGRTNEAAAQYERIAREFADETTLANLSRQNLRGLGISIRANESLPSSAAKTGALLPPASRARMKELLEEEIKIAEATLAEMRQRIKVGTAAPEEGFRFQKEVTSLKRQLLAVDGLTGSEVRRQWRDLLLEEIGLAEKAVKIEQTRAANGRSLASEVSRLQREVLAAKRELVTFDSLPTETSPEQGAAAAGATDEEAREIQRIRDLIRNSPDLINAYGKDGQFPLQAAASKGYLTVAQFLLDNKADINLADKEGSALHLAASSGHMRMVELLISRGAQVNLQNRAGFTPLHLAVAKGYRELAEVLLAHKADPNLADQTGRTPLMSTLLNGRPGLAELLIEHHADLNLQMRSDNRPRVQPSGGTSIGDGGTALHIMTGRGDKAPVEFLISKGADVNAQTPTGLTPLHHAAVNGSLDIARELLKAKAAIDAKAKGPHEGWTPLHFAVDNNRVEMVALLLEHKADPNRTVPSYRNESAQNFAPLHMAFWVSTNMMVEQLLKHGANPNVQQSAGTTPLHYAVVWGNRGLVKLLLEHKADPNVRDNEARTPLLKAAEAAQVDIAELLLDNGANPNLADDKGQTALHFVAGRDMRAGSRPLRGASTFVVAQGAPVPGQDNPAPQEAADPSTRLARALLNHKAEANGRAADGRTPLHWAVETSKANLVELLIAEGADINATNHAGITALRVAVGQCSSEMVRLLLAHKPDVHICDTNGTTVLHYATRSCNINLMKALLEAGADPARRCSNKLSAFELAIENNVDLSRTELLRSYHRPKMNKLTLSGAVKRFIWFWNSEEPRTVSQALDVAQLTEKADPRRVKLFRLDPASGLRTVSTLDLEAIKTGRKSDLKIDGILDKDIPIQDDDRIEVPEW